MRVMHMDGKSYAQRLVEERTGRDLPTLLRELYVERRWPDQEIAGQLGVSRAAVAAWRVKFGISRDDRKAELIP